MPGGVVHVDETDGGQAVPASGKSVWNHVETWIQRWEGESDEVYDAASVISMVYRVRVSHGHDTFPFPPLHSTFPCACSAFRGTGR
jgi:hypothetical protein